MYILGIEAATPVAGVAVVDEHRVLAERFVNNKKTHSVNLLPMIRDVINEAGIKPHQLEGIAVSAGPGSFTGLRIGMTTAKTLAQVWGLPVMAVPTLEALAYPLTGFDGLVCPILNARKNEVYAGLYEGYPDMKKLTVPMAVSVPELVSILKGYQRRVLFLGDGVDIYRREIIYLLGSKADFASQAVMLPRGAAVAEYGAVMLQQGIKSSPLEIKPEYIRPSEAEVKWAEKQRVNGECCCGS